MQSVPSDQKYHDEYSVLSSPLNGLSNFDPIEKKSQEYYWEIKKQADAYAAASVGVIVGGMFLLPTATGIVVPMVVSGYKAIDLTLGYGTYSAMNYGIGRVIIPSLEKTGEFASYGAEMLYVGLKNANHISNNVGNIYYQAGAYTQTNLATTLLNKAETKFPLLKFGAEMGISYGKS
jgi:hypothetical protein